MAAVVFAAVGTNAQRTWVYDRLRPYAGTHVIVGGCASYHAAVDHHLGALAASLGDLDAAGQHFTSALAMHERLGAAGWARITEDALASLARPTNEFRQTNGLWLLSYAGTQAQIADSKGLHDLAVLIGAQGNDVHVSTLIGPGFVRTVSARVRDALSKLDHTHPVLAGHLREAVQLGTMCSYSPEHNTHWRLK